MSIDTRQSIPHPLGSLEPIRGLPNLRSVSLEGEGRLDLEPLASLTRLEDLYFLGVEVVGLDALVRLECLERVVLNYAGITDLTPFADWREPPNFLGLQHNRIRDLSPLVANLDFGRGHKIDLSFNCIERPSNLLADDMWLHPIRVLWRRGVYLVLDHQSRSCGAHAEEPGQGE